MLKHCIVLFLLIAAPLWAAPVQQPHVQADLVSEVTSIQPGAPFWVALNLKMESGWHTYYKIPGDSGLPTTLEWTLPPGFTASPIHWLPPERIELPQIVNYGYHGDILLLVQITPPANLPPNTSASLRAKATWLVCKESCIPGDADLSLDLPVSAAPPPFNATWKARFDDARQKIADAETKNPPSRHPTFLNALLFAFLGGLILNLMPCVFPVLSIKILNFIQHAGGDRRILRLHGFLFTLGVVISFWILVALLLILRAGGQQLGWGFQLQSPTFVVLIALLLFILALNLLGVFEIGTSLVSLAGYVPKKNLLSSFFTGVLATIVATPCTAPFMGIALAFALAQPPLASFTIFTALALGLAFPYLLLTFFPFLLHHLPKPGEWMESLKQAMAFPLLAAVVWLIWVLSFQVDNANLLSFLIGLLFTAIAVWIYGRWHAPHRSPKAKTIGTLAAILFAILALLIALDIQPLAAKPSQATNPFAVTWQPYSSESLQQLRAQRKPVFIDFTAAWCATCQVNKIALHAPAVRKKFHQLGVVPLVADWTNRDAAITQAIQSYGRSGVPLYVLYDANPDVPPRILPEVITPNIVLHALETLSQPSPASTLKPQEKTP